MHGVEKVVAGYHGGQPDTAHYETVSFGTTGHAESVKVTFDPTQVSYGQLLQVFFSEHDPTTLNAQFPNSGSVSL
jgi:peptide-methionine (S)-S-oxide reductase